MARTKKKINFPTNVVNPITYATYMQMIDSQPGGQVDAAYAGSTLFPAAKKGKDGAAAKDTHTIGVLIEYGLAKYVDDKKKIVSLTHFGKRLLEVFQKGADEDSVRMERKDDVDINYNALMLEILLNWSTTVEDKVFYPGALIIRLLMDERLDFKFNAFEWEFVCENEEFIDTGNYDKLVSDVIEFRKSGEEIDLKKANDFCNSLANSWALLEKNNEKFYLLRELTKENLTDWRANNKDLLYTISALSSAQGAADDRMDALSHNFYGMHITNRNSAVTSGEINIGWSCLEDLTSIDSKDALSARYDEKYPNQKPRKKAQDISQIWTFINGMSIGDYVVFGDGANAHIGIIKSDYYYEVDATKRDEDYANNRTVEWLKSFKYTELPKAFKSSLSSARSVFSLNAYKSLILELLEKGVVDIDDDEGDESEEEDMEEARPYIKLNFTTNLNCDFERNRIVFGAPGTGKSYQMEEDRATLVAMGGDYERVTFHPDYSYSSFVGCYKPISEKGKIEYKYVPGPFMRVLVEALRSGLTDDPKPYLLIIEEINRAKVAAVFGEVFQLLDRDSSGTSDYEIHTSEDVKKYLSDELNGSLESFKRIRIPNNMFIWATMNSADQGVFPMDTAFKRRWSFEYKGIDENEDKVGGLIVLGKGESEFEVDWNILRKAINDVLAKKFAINEDKLMGPFFISEDVFAADESGYIKNPEKFKKVFKSKVIMYLYEDAAKQQKHKLFSGCDSTKYSSICDAFDKIGIDIFGADFKDTYNDLR